MAVTVLFHVPALLLLVVPTPQQVSPEVAKHRDGFAHLLELRSPTVTVDLAPSATVSRVRIQPLPLYRGAEWAITSRWDDHGTTTS